MKAVLKTILVDDNLMEITALENYCKSDDRVDLIEMFDNAKCALSFLSEKPVDLMILDVQMPEMSGLDLLAQISYFPQIILTSSNKEYAYDAMEYDATDFIKKPLSLTRFQKAMNKVEDRFEKMNAVALSSASTELYVKTDGKLIRTPYSEILYFENVGDYIKVISERGLHIIYGALKALAERLTYPRFLKVHRSYIVNLDKIVDIEDNSLVIGKKLIPISRAHKPLLMSSINII